MDTEAHPDLSVGAHHGAGQAARPRPRGGVGLAVDLSDIGYLQFRSVFTIEYCSPDVLLVVEDLLVPAPGPVLHVGQAPDPAAHLDVDLLVVYLDVAAASPEREIPLARFQKQY